MVIIDINEQKNVKLTLFNDNQPHVRLDPIIAGEPVKVICRLKSSLDLMHLLQVSDALDRLHCSKMELVIPYLMGARYDRVMVAGDSLDMAVVANLINMTGFEAVLLVDPHSDVSTALIKNPIVINNMFLVRAYQRPDPVLIVPDAGAAKKAPKYVEWLEKNGLGQIDIVNCFKERDVNDGSLRIKMLNPEVCEGRNCVIIDDICDGGRTFIEAARQATNPESMTLIVTHGIFSQGLSPLIKEFDQIIVSDSYQDWSIDSKQDSDLVNCVKLNLENI